MRTHIARAGIHAKSLMTDRAHTLCGLDGRHGPFGGGVFANRRGQRFTVATRDAHVTCKSCAARAAKAQQRQS
jgi:hypothetical protein